MGGLCSKQEGDSFAQPGRRLDSAPPPRTSAPTAPLPSGAKPKVGGPPRTLGGSGGGGKGAASSSSDADDARRKAAAAAEARAQGASKGGKLAAQLQAQKKQTRNDNLKEASDTERRRRDQDATAEAIAHN